MKRMITAVLAAAILGGSSLAYSAEVDNRQVNQEKRIDQGVASGELTHREAKKLRKDERKIHREVKRDRAENGGTLTPAEKAKVNRQENRESRKIYRKKHNDVREKDAK